MSEENKQYPKPKRHWTWFDSEDKFENATLLSIFFKSKHFPEGDTIKRRFCNKCIAENHHLIQGDIMEFGDCKTVFRDKDGNVRGQCNCSCYEHGVRKQRW